MTHNVHILLGNNAEQNMRLIYEYIIKNRTEYADENGRNVMDFLQLLLVKDDGEIVRARHDQEADFISGIEDGYVVGMDSVGAIDPKRKEYSLSRFFAKMFADTVNLQNPGDRKLHIFLHVPVFEAKYWDLAKIIIGGVVDARIGSTIGVYLEAADLYHIYDASEDKMYEYETSQKQVLTDALSYQKEFEKDNELPLAMIFMQNINEDGVSLNLNKHSYANLIGELALAVTLNYVEIFNNAFGASIKENGGFVGLGFSMLSFDRYYFVQYLLRRAYLYVLNREKVFVEDVDVNAVSNRVHKILSQNVNLFSDFYNNVVRTLLETGNTHEVVVEKITPELDKRLQELEQEFTSYIHDESLSLPEKRATLAQLLGQDDFLLKGEMFNKSQLILDDCQCEAMDVFIEANNKLLDVPEDELGEDNRPIVSHAILSPTSPREPHPTARMIVDEMKRVMISTKQNSEYIRSTTDLLAKIEDHIGKSIESKKCLTQDGFIFNGITYRLLPDNIEKPLEETIEFPVRDLPTAVDLRQQFTPIKSQGPLGACTVFALTSIFEYILKKNNKENSDLSEHFVYYNVLKNQSKLEEYGKVGTSHYDVVKSIGTEGICLESLCEYSGNFDTSEPSAEAYEDAKARKITKAMNVRIDLNQIKSALAEGYPVAVGLRVFDSLASSTGFVQRPTDDELKEEVGWHSMVVCGYSDKEKIFIVRNSWGIDFGDNGYCYIPYSYICDPLLCHQATVITEVGIANIVVAGTDSKTAVSFNEADSRIQAAIYRNLIEEEKIAQKANMKLYESISVYYRAVIAKIGGYDVRQELLLGTEERLKYERRILTEQGQTLSTERMDALDAFDKETNMSWWGLGLTLATIVIVVGTLIYFFGVKDILFTEFNYWTSCVEVLCLGLFLWCMRRRREERFRIDKDYMQKLSDIEVEKGKRTRELDVIKLRMHVAGIVHQKLTPFVFDLRNMYSGMVSYVNNLREWYKELENTEDVVLVDHQPFNTVIVPSYLDEYFNEGAEDLTSQIRLYRLFTSGQYKISEKEIVAFKQNMKNILAKELFDNVSDFSLYAYVTGGKSYKYLPSRDEQVGNVMTAVTTLDRNSAIFVKTYVRVNGQSVMQKCLFCDKDAQNDRGGIEASFGTNRPMICDLLSNFKMFVLRLEILQPTELDVLSS